MFSSLRFRLWATFAAVILISLLIAGSAFSLLIRNYYAQAATERLADLAVPSALAVGILERSGAPADVMSAFLQDQGNEIGVRYLLVNDGGLVVSDTTGTLNGQVIDFRSNSTVLLRWNQKVFTGAMKAPDNTEIYYVGAKPDSGRKETDSYYPSSSSYRVILAIPQQSQGEAWLQVAPVLGVAAFLALVVSVGLSSLFARTIAGPIVKITRASEAMARGDFEQNIDVKGRDEVARLARSFNAMAKHVSTTNRTLREFLANASHELKTPLTSIQGFSQAMVDGAIETPEEYARAAEIINAEAGRMRNLVDDLLLLSRMESGDVSLDREPLELRDVLNTCIERFRWQAEKQGISLSAEVSADLGVVTGDSGRLEQVFGNLIDNALRYTPHGGDVFVSAEVVTGAPAETTRPDGVKVVSGTTQWLCVRVHNTGSWIPPEDLTRVFDRFYRSRGRPDSSVDGSGLGLAIVREIVQAHGGSVVARSDRDSGTEFEVCLPAMPSGDANVAKNKNRSNWRPAWPRRSPNAQND